MRRHSEKACPRHPNAGLEHLGQRMLRTRFRTLHAEQGTDKQTLMGRKSYDYSA
jgi:hypothetical protein